MKTMEVKEPIRHPFGSSEGLALEFKRATDHLPSNFFETVCAFLNMDGGLIERTIPDKPRSRLQKYRLTGKGRAALKTMKDRNP